MMRNQTFIQKQINGIFGIHIKQILNWYLLIKLDELMIYSNSIKSIFNRRRMLREQLPLASSYPLYIVLKNYNSCTLMELLNFSKQNKLEICFQTHLNKLVKLGGKESDKYFVILCDFDRVPSLQGQFLNLKCLIVEYPKFSLDSILEKYLFFVNSDSFNTKYSISSIYLPENKVNQSVFLKNQNKMVKFICASQIYETKKQVQKILFMYKSRYDGSKYTNYFSFLKTLEINNKQIVFLNTIDQYFLHIGQKDKKKYCMIISQNTAMYLRKYLRKVDDFLVLGQTMKTCSPLLKANIAYLTCDELQMNKMLVQKFQIKELVQIVSIFSQKQKNNYLLDQIDNAIEFQEFKSSHSSLNQIKLSINCQKEEEKPFLGTADTNFSQDESNQSQLQKVYKVIKKFKSYALRNRKQSPGKFKVTKNIKYRKNVLFSKISTTIQENTH